MKIAYFDCIAGASGDMILAALLDAGLSEPTLRTALDALKLSSFDLNVQQVLKSGFKATQVSIHIQEKSPPRHLEEIQSIIRASSLNPGIQEKALDIFQRLAGVEAGIHGKSISEVHLHELSGDDTIVDVVGALIGLQELGVERMIVSPIPLGRGFVESAHGQIPLPAPATLELLQKAPIYGSQLEVELVTPTAAVLLTSLAHSFGTIPSMQLEAVGYGAGKRDLPIPNLLRVLLGTASLSMEAVEVETLVILETNLDDLNPQFYDHIFTRLFQEGALDVFLSPVQMKKNRPGTLLSVLCSPLKAEVLETVLFSETSTLGVRRKMVERHALPRAIRPVHTSYGSVRIKIAWLGKDNLKASPELEDCRALAELHHIPVREIYLEAQVAAQRWLEESRKDLNSPENYPNSLLEEAD